jgi:hypothetical protein
MTRVLHEPVSVRNAEADTTGTTTLGKRVIDHSFQLPLQIGWIVTALVGCLIVWILLVYAASSSAPAIQPVQRSMLRLPSAPTGF